MKQYWVYILVCSDGTLYTGYTTNLDKRIIKHNLKQGAKYTRSRLPVKLVYSQVYEDKSAALKREIQIKSLSRSDKFILINKNRNDNILMSMLIDG